MHGMSHGYHARPHIDEKILCYKCGELGHKSTYCQEEKISEAELQKIKENNPESQLNNMRVVCFNCK